MLKELFCLKVILTAFGPQHKTTNDLSRSQLSKVQGSQQAAKGSLLAAEWSVPKLTYRGESDKTRRRANERRLSGLKSLSLKSC